MATLILGILNLIGSLFGLIDYIVMPVFNYLTGFVHPILKVLLGLLLGITALTPPDEYLHDSLTGMDRLIMILLGTANIWSAVEAFF